VGYQAGRYISGGSSSNGASSTSLYLGAETKALASGGTNEIVLGYDTTGFGSNTAAYGNSSITSHIFQAGNVGIETSSPTYILSLGGNAARTFWVERHTTENTAGNTLTVQAGGATVGATDKAGGDLLLYPGVSTGSAESGVQIYGCVAGASGTADRTQTLAFRVLGNKIGFFGATPVTKATEITDELTTITFTAPTPDYAIQDFVDVSLGAGWAFKDHDEANTTLAVIANLQARVNELETVLVNYGLLTDAD